MAVHNLKFEFKKTTSGTVVFEEKPPKGQPPVVGSLYVKKWAAGDAKEIDVAVTIPD